MVREYIGARYVPKFMGTYDATQVYEALCVVDNGLGTSYISKVPTPAGIPLTNTTYWAVYGASSGAIINLQNQIGDLSNLNTADQSSLVNAINEVDSDVQTLTKEVSIFNLSDNSNIIVIGDSWANGLHATHGLWYWLDRFLPHNDFYHNQENGSGFAALGVNIHTFLDLLQIVETGISNDDSITHIIVMGGLNDENLSGVSSAVNTFCNYAHTTFPNAAISIIAVNRSQFGAMNRYDYITAYESIANELPYVKFIDCTHLVPIEYWHNASHLEENGYLIVARNVANILLGGTPSTTCRRTSVTLTDSTNAINVTGYLYQSSDGSLLFKTPLINVSGTFALGGLVKGLRLALDTPISGTNTVEQTFNAYVTDSNGSRLITGNAYFNNSQELVLAWVDSNGSADYTALYILSIVINFGLSY